MVTKRERVVGINPEFGISRCTLLYIKQIKKDLLYSTGNYIQYLEISYDGKESKNHLYLHLNHVAVHLKHCSSTILQFFKKCKKKKKDGGQRLPQRSRCRDDCLPASGSAVFPLSRSEFLFSLHLLLIMKAHYFMKGLHMFA